MAIAEAERRVMNMTAGQQLTDDDVSAIQEVMRHRDQLRQLAEQSARLLEVPMSGRVARIIGKGSGV